MTVLVITETNDLAADLVVLGLQRRGIPYYRLNQDTFPAEIEICYSPGNSAAVFYAGSKRFFSYEVSAAWCRGSRRDSRHDAYVRREVQDFLEGLWGQMTWAWVNNPAAVAEASNKLWQLQTACEIGFDIPRTVITNNAAQVRDAFGSGQVIAKTIGGAAVDHDGMRQHVYSQAMPAAELDPEAVKAAPCIFQEQVKPGTDVRVTVVGDRVFATDIEAPAAPVDWRAASLEMVNYRTSELPTDAAKRCVELCRIAGLSYGAFDFVRQPGGRYVFLEVNPSGQWGWIERATGQPITAAIVDVLVRQGEGT